MCKCQCRSVSVCSANVVEVSVCKCTCRNVSVQGIFRKNPSQCFREKGSIYGLRESPKLWGDYRDVEISQMSFMVENTTYEYQQSFAEENLWLVRRRDSQEGAKVEGLALVYVDDVMLFGAEEVVEKGLQCFRKTWETSEPTWVTAKEPVRYCGMELSRTEQGDYFANQCSYLREVVRRHGMEDLCSAQIMKDPQEPEDELNAPTALIREAQQLAGELL